MQIALSEAKIAFEKGEIPVGCVIVRRKDNKIIAFSHNLVEQEQNPILHAEIIAINNACKQLDNKNLSNCDIYVTLEPCTMCASAISNARLGSLYYGAEDLKQGAIENGVRFFTSKSCFYRPNIYSFVKSEESKVILQSFFSKIRKNKV
jgi:cytosine deaminase